MDKLALRWCIIIFLGQHGYIRWRGFSLILLAEENLKHLKKPRSVWVRKHFQIRLVMGEFHTSFHYLIDHPDKIYQNYNDWKSLILTQFTPLDQTGGLLISGEDKLVLAIVKILFLFLLRKIINLLQMVHIM